MKHCGGPEMRYCSSGTGMELLSTKLAADDWGVSADGAFDSI